MLTLEEATLTEQRRPFPDSRFLPRSAVQSVTRKSKHEGRQQSSADSEVRNQSQINTQSIRDQTAICLHHVLINSNRFIGKMASRQGQLLLVYLPVWLTAATRKPILITWKRLIYWKHTGTGREKERRMPREHDVCERVLSMYNGLAPRATRKTHIYTLTGIHYIYFPAANGQNRDSVLYKCVCVYVCVQGCCWVLGLLGFRVVVVLRLFWGCLGC